MIYYTKLTTQQFLDINFTKLNKYRKELYY